MFYKHLKKLHHLNFYNSWAFYKGLEFQKF